MRREWLKNENEYLQHEYAMGKKEDIINTLNRSWSSILSRANKLGLKKINVNIKGSDVKIWTKTEDEYLKINYSSLEKEKMEYFLNRTWSSIQQRAFQLKLQRKEKHGNSSKLLDKSNEAYYWLGFIMADGHFNKNNQIQINLSIKDLEHLKKFATFVEYKGKLIKPSISIGFGKIRDELNNLFKISNDKTHSPCILDNLSGDSFFSFIIGFIDGDGCINTKGYLTIKCHKNWLDNLNKMISELSNNNFNQGRINSEGLAIIQLTKLKLMKEIKIKIIELELPILNRKWDRVDLNKEIKIDKSKRMKDECYKLFEANILPKDIIKTTNLNRGFVYRTHQDYINNQS